MIRKEYILYGLDKHRDVIDEIICYINSPNDDFDIRLILTEALTNAFKHGNKNNIDKPIYLRYAYNCKNVNFEIEDSGTGFKDINIPERISNDGLLDDYGRGLFLIKSIASKIEFRNNTLFIQKDLIRNINETPFISNL